MSAGIIVLGVYMLIGAAVMCLSIWMNVHHNPDHPAARKMKGYSKREAATGYILSCLAWPLLIYIICKKGNDQP